MSPQPSLPNFFAGPYIDRRSEVREDAAALRAIRADPTTRYVLSVGGQHLLLADQSGDTAKIAFLGADHPLVSGAAETELVLLGRFLDAWCILVDLPEQSIALPAATALAELRPLAAILPAPESALLAYARVCRCGAHGSASVVYADSRRGPSVAVMSFGAPIRSRPTNSFRASIRRSSCW